MSDTPDRWEDMELAEPVPIQPDGIDPESHDLPLLHDAAGRVKAYLSEFGDGLVDVGGDTFSKVSAPLYARDLQVLADQVDDAPSHLRRLLDSCTLHRERAERAEKERDEALAADKPYCSCADADSTYAQLETEFVRVSKLAKKRLAAREDWKARCLFAQAEAERLRDGWRESDQYHAKTGELLLWLHAEASWWLALSRDEYEADETLHVWFQRCQYAEQRLARVEASRRDWAAEAMQLQLQVDARLCTGDHGCLSPVHIPGCFYSDTESPEHPAYVDPDQLPLFDLPKETP